MCTTRFAASFSPVPMRFSTADLLGLSSGFDDGSSCAPGPCRANTFLVTQATNQSCAPRASRRFLARLHALQHGRLAGLELRLWRRQLMCSWALPRMHVAPSAWQPAPTWAPCSAPATRACNLYPWEPSAAGSHCAPGPTQHLGGTWGMVGHHPCLRALPFATHSYPDSRHALFQYRSLACAFCNHSCSEPTHGCGMAATFTAARMRCVHMSILALPARQNHSTRPSKPG